METWNEISNLRTTLLHLQFIDMQLKEQIQLQNHNIQRAQQDRLVQYFNLSKEHRLLQKANFQKILIVKLQQCLALFEKCDQTLWQHLDPLLTFVKMQQELMASNVAKLYLGKDVLVDLNKIQQAFETLELKIQSFIAEKKIDFEKYGNANMQVEGLKKEVEILLSEIEHFYEEIRPVYGCYLRKWLKQKGKTIECNIGNIRKFILE